MSDKNPEQSADTPSRRRSVRSFVVRSGRVTAAQQRALTELWPLYCVESEAAPLNLDEIFGRQAPRMIEIGFGAGEALLEFARAHPEMDCLGLEVHRPGIGHLLLGLQAAQITNTRVICRDAVEVLERQIAPESIDLIHIFFPDPWPKKRHHKRRLIQPEFVELLASRMRPNALLRLATDWEHYAHHMHETLDACAALENLSTDGTGFVSRPDVRPLTRFERRGQRLGHAVWDLAYRKRA
jgi:tRNA (guanine-N7-)-methyltransferase